MKDHRKGNLLYRYSNIVDERLSQLRSLYKGLSIVTLEGERAAIIEQHSGILRYTQEEVIVSLGKYQVCIRGIDLQIGSMDRDSIRVDGRITGVEYQYREHA